MTNANDIGHNRLIVVLKAEVDLVVYLVIFWLNQERGIILRL